jgi:hypothetical protein
MTINIIKNENSSVIINEIPRKYRMWHDFFSQPKSDIFNIISDFDYKVAAANGFHFVCVARTGLTFFSSVCRYCFSLDNTKQDKYKEIVNKNNETGTIFPLVNLTILPYRNTILGNHDIESEGHNLEIEEIFKGKSVYNPMIEKDIIDAFEAELNYVKSGKIIFDFRDLGSALLCIYNKILHQITENKYKDIKCEVYYYSFNNIDIHSKYWSYPKYYTISEQVNFERNKQLRFEDIKKEKEEKQKRKELKHQLKLPLLKEKQIKINQTRDYYKHLRSLHFKTQLKKIAESNKPVYFYSQLICEIIEKNDLQSHKEVLEQIISKFKIIEVRNFKKIKIQLQEIVNNSN